MQERRCTELVEQSIGSGAIGDIAAGEQKADGAAQPVGQGMDFGGASASRATDGLIALPPFPPEAQRCAFTADESISTSAAGPPAGRGETRRAVLALLREAGAPDGTAEVV